MSKERDGMNEVNKVCKAVLKLTDDDFIQARVTAKEQQEYTHPLKMATARRQRELGDHNMQVLDALETLREVIKDGANIKKP